MDILPEELLRYIVSLVEDLSSAMALCQVSKHIRALVFECIVVLRSPRPVVLKKFFLFFSRLARTEGIVLELENIYIQPSLVDTSVRITSAIYANGGRNIPPWECGSATLRRRTEKIVELLVQGRRDVTIRISVTRSPVEYVFVDNGRILRWTNYDVPRIADLRRSKSLFRGSLGGRKYRALCDNRDYDRGYGFINPLAVKFFHKIGLHDFAEHISDGVCLLSVYKVMKLVVEKHGIPFDIYGPIAENIRAMGTFDYFFEGRTSFQLGKHDPPDSRKRTCTSRVLDRPSKATDQRKDYRSVKRERTTRKKARSAPTGKPSNRWNTIDSLEERYIIDRLTFLHPTHRWRGSSGLTEVEMLDVRLPRNFPPEGCDKAIQLAILEMQGGI